MDGYLIFSILLLFWLSLVIVLKKYVKNSKISFFGPAIMLKTERGKKFIEKISRFKFWVRYGNFGVFFSFIIMFATLGLLIWEATLVPSIPKSRAPSPIQALGLPGINPLIPLWYGLIAIIIAVIVHEFSHGILTAYHKLKIKSLGVLLFIVPIGAFVEPDEEELNQTERIKRMRVFAAGATTNILIAIVMAILFFAMFSGVTPKTDGVLVNSVYANPYSNFQVGMEIVSINNTPIKSINDLNQIHIMPGTPVNAQILYDNLEKNLTVYTGVILIAVLSGTPAAASGLKTGDMILSIDNTTIYNENALTTFLDNTTVNQSIKVYYLHYSNHQILQSNVTISLMDKYLYYSKNAPAQNSGSFKGKGFLGISSSYLGLGLIDVSLIPKIMSNPFGYVQSFTSGLLLFISLPFLGLAPLPDSIVQLYNTPIASVIFWPLVNVVYWLFWINLMLGMTNLLPAVPLDGGYLFKDGILAFIKKFNITVKNSESLASFITIIFSFTILFLILWQFIGPRIL